jgi:glycosyltransferase involved in cell wall biosynthesis
MPKALFFANTDWYLWNFRRPLIASMRARGWDVVLVAPPGPWLPKLAAEGFRCIAFPLERHGLNPLAELGAVRRLAVIYRRERPDLVHHFTIKCVLYGGIAARIVPVRAIVNAITGLGTLFTTRTMKSHFLLLIIRTMYRFALARGHVIFQNRDDLATFMDNRLIPAGNTHLIRGSGVDVARFKPPSRPPATPPVVVLLVARLNREKGLEEFVAAAGILVSSGLPVRCLVAGQLDTGHPQAIDEQRLALWKASGHVTFLGHRQDMPELLHSTHIACLPSWGGEGIPRSLLEAMSCGLPIVTTDVPGCREAVRDGENGLVVPPRATASLASALHKLILDPEMRARMGNRSRERAEEEFSEDRVIAETLAVYRSALGTADL